MSNCVNLERYGLQNNSAEFYSRILYWQYKTYQAVREDG
jgi:hypothetical protein